MASSNPNDELAQRTTRPRTDEAQPHAAFPRERVAAAVRRIGLRAGQLETLITDGHPDRPALTPRPAEPILDENGHGTRHLSPEYETIAYHQLWQRAGAIANVWHHDPRYRVRPGDVVAILGGTGIDHTTLEVACDRLGLECVPVRAETPAQHWHSNHAETPPRILAASLDLLDAAIHCVSTRAEPQVLIVFDLHLYDYQLDCYHWQAVDTARRSLAAAGSAILVEDLPTVLTRGSTLPAAPTVRPDTGETTRPG
ncbi:AMP-binding protein [Nocardia terpenica]|uniref:AMP-dependent synthetase/ligase domain-containing protein n=1 Tax=Nocardia terpenica TaxID=455432 RepID=A0A164NUU4_9NOCA|nr:AMP-binding protein [Nocardia terpenica]KZM74753.1 hypothetical protein AWN90_22150 [Nocardia terpenica]NQE93624.1 AMP-binding protein [Nocardia terpenica]